MVNSYAFLARTLAKYFQGIKVGDQQQRYVHRRDDIAKAEVSRIRNERGPQDHGQEQVGYADNVEDPHGEQQWLSCPGALQPYEGDICERKADKITKCRRIRKSRRQLARYQPGDQQRCGEVAEEVDRREGLQLLHPRLLDRKST